MFVASCAGQDVNERGANFAITVESAMDMMEEAASDGEPLQPGDTITDDGVVFTPIPVISPVAVPPMGGSDGGTLGTSDSTPAGSSRLQRRSEDEPAELPPEEVTEVDEVAPLEPIEPLDDPNGLVTITPVPVDAVPSPSVGLLTPELPTPTLTTPTPRRRLTIQPPTANPEAGVPGKVNVAVLSSPNRVSEAERVAMMLSTFQNRRLEAMIGQPVEVAYVSQSTRPHTTQTIIRYREGFLKAAVQIAAILPFEQVVEPMTADEANRDSIDVIIYVGLSLQ